MSEFEINKAISALIEAHGLNYGAYTGIFGLEARYIKTLTKHL